MINVDDRFGSRLAEEVSRAGGRVRSYGFAPDADVRVQEASWDMRTARLRLATPDGVVACATRLPGRHNALNVAAAVAAGQAAGVGPELIRDAVEATAPPPGRFEVIDEGQPFDVIVDYAHTPDGIRQLLSSARAVAASRGGAAVRTVFGAVGLRDPGKARESGRLLRALSDHLILTTGTAPGDARIPRLSELKRAGVEGGTVEIVLERRAAIQRAVDAARPRDVVAVLGVGAVPRLVLDEFGTVTPFDDREAAHSALLKTDRSRCA